MHMSSKPKTWNFAEFEIMQKGKPRLSSGIPSYKRHTGNDFTGNNYQK